MDRFSLDDLRVFAAVARAGSVTRGAGELGSTQSTASAQLAALERRLGFQLFERTSRGMRLTGRGSDLLARLGPSLDAAVDAVARTLGTSSRAETLFLGGPAELLSEVILPRLLPGPTTTTDTGTSPSPTPQPELRVEFGLAEDLLDRLEAGELDVVVSTVQPRCRGVAFLPLYDEEFVLVMAPALVGAFRANPDGVPVVTYSEELPIIRRYWRSIFNRPPSRLRAAAVVPDLRVLATLAAGGAGMTVLPRYLATPLLATGRLVDPVGPEVPPLNTIYVARRRQRAGAAGAVDELVGRLRQLFAGASGPAATSGSATASDLAASDVSTSTTARPTLAADCGF